MLIPYQKVFCKKPIRVLHSTSAQHSVQWMVGILRFQQALFWLRVFLAPEKSPRPPTRRYPLKGTMSQTVGQFLAKDSYQYAKKDTRINFISDYPFNLRFVYQSDFHQAKRGRTSFRLGWLRRTLGAGFWNVVFHTKH